MEFSKKLFFNTYWAFNRDQYSDESTFITELSSYHEQISGSGLPFDKNEIVLSSAQLVLQYVIYPEDGDPLEPQFVLHSNDQNGFTAAEILFKANNYLYDKLKEEDHVYFEGLLFATDSDPEYDGIPVYFVLLGN